MLPLSFNDNAALQVQGFEAAPTQANVGTLKDGRRATATLSGAAIAAIQAAKGQGESKVQLRLQYPLDDNDNGSNDYTGYYSSDNSNAIRHPKLIIDYTLAD